MVDPEAGRGVASEGRSADEVVSEVGMATMDAEDTVADVVDTEDQAADRR